MKSKRASIASEEKPNHPALKLVRGLIWPLLAIALPAAAAGAVIEALLFRGILDVSANLALAGQRMGAVIAVLLFCLALLLLEWPMFASGARLGRILENQFRIAVLEKLPKLRRSILSQPARFRYGGAKPYHGIAYATCQIKYASL